MDRSEQDRMRRLSTGELLCVSFLDTDVSALVIQADGELARRGYPHWLVVFLRKACAMGLWHQAVMWEEWHLDLKDVAIGYIPILIGAGAFIAVVGHMIGHWAELIGVGIAVSGFVVLGLVILRARLWRALTPVAPLRNWFNVTFDEDRVTMAASPPGREPWEQSFRWSEVERICFKSEGALASDGIYIFTTQRPESFAVPTEATGGPEFWAKIIERGLVPPEYAIKTATLTGGEMLCWPSIHS